MLKPLWPAHLGIYCPRARALKIIDVHTCRYYVLVCSSHVVIYVICFDACSIMI